MSESVRACVRACVLTCWPLAVCCDAQLVVPAAGVSLMR